MKGYIIGLSMVATVGLSSLNADSGERVFKSYCWGCHHQTAEAFGPSFEEIAPKRNAQEIKAMVTDPASVSKEFGYSRNAMPPFKLTSSELDMITEYILSFKKTKKVK